jgi:hypothetical protein
MELMSAAVMSYPESNDAIPGQSRRLTRDGAVIAERGEYRLCWERAILWAIPVTLNIVYLENQFKNCIYFPRLRSIITIHVGP